MARGLWSHRQLTLELRTILHARLSSWYMFKTPFIVVASTVTLALATRSPSRKQVGARPCRLAEDLRG